RPLAYREPERLVSVRSALEARGATNLPSSAPEYLDYRREVPALQDIAAVWPININLTGHGDPERIQAAGVSSNYFSVLGVAPALGREFTAEDDGGRIGYVTLISWDLWQRRFGGARDVVGKTVRLDDDPMTIIGVMPRGFRHPVESGASPMELWAPMELANTDSNFINFRGMRVFELFGRLTRGATIDQANRQFEVLRGRLAERYPDTYLPSLGWRVEAAPLAERVVGDVRPALLVLLGAVGFVLLIGCVNVANLLLARATTRDREIAIRTALGGGRARLIRQLLTESLLLAVIGGALGLALAVWGTEALGRLAVEHLPRARDIGVDWNVLGFTAVMVLVTGIGFGLIPALQTTRPDLQSVLKDAGRGSSAGAPRARVRSALVVAEVAIALMLLAGAGLLLRSFERLLAVETGFNPDGLLTLQVWLPWPNQPDKGRYFTQEQRLAFYERAVTQVRQVPGVESVALTNRLPLRGRSNARFTIEGRTPPPDEPPPIAEYRLVTPSYFETMQIPILRGEGLSELADSASAGTAVINRTMGEKYFPDEDPIGRRIQAFGPDGPWLTIRGVVGDVRQMGLEEPPVEEFYLSARTNAGQEMAMIVRTSGDPESHAAAVTRAIRSADPEQPVFSVMSMDRLIANASAERRFSLVLLTLFATIALILSAIGIYGVMAYATTQRRHEIGIRLALGAAGSDVLRLVIAQGMRLVVIGLAAGLFGAWVLSRVLASQLFGITAQDPLTYLTVALLLGLVALGATWLPARRATRVDPMISLRTE
ncbi:MAG: ABC transporter permease, partial [Gemmatimonadales bacterium]|nr:ABC transporter permease [Gemmatimonadales bacterium]